MTQIPRFRRVWFNKGLKRISNAEIDGLEKIETVVLRKNSFKIPYILSKVPNLRYLEILGTAGTTTGTLNKAIIDLKKMGLLKTRKKVYRVPKQGTEKEYYLTSKGKKFSTLLKKDRILKINRVL